jgi:RNA recognition motif-containing protein
MEEQKIVPVIIAVVKDSKITLDNIKDHFKNLDMNIIQIPSPKGFEIKFNEEEGLALLEKGEDQILGETVIYAEQDPHCTVYIKPTKEEAEKNPENKGFGELQAVDISNALASEGKICLASIAKGANHKAIGSAFVRFCRKADALRAVENHPKVTVNNIELECTKYDENSRPAKASSIESAKFSNVPTQYSEEYMKNLLSKYGVVEEISLDVDERTGTVSYSKYGAVAQAIQDLNGKTLGDKVFIISDTSEKRKNTNKYNNLFIGNIGPDVTEKELREKFGEFGEIESLLRPTRKITENGENITINKNHCFLSFKDPKNASDVIKAMDNQYFWNRKLEVDYYKAKDQMAQKNQSDNTANMAEAFMQMMVSTMGNMVNNMNTGRCVCFNLSINPAYRRIWRPTIPKLQRRKQLRKQLQ